MTTEELNDHQRAFVESTSKHITVSARPGTGKTHAFAWRIVLDQGRGVDPSSQIIVTKTVAAALQMESRIETIADKHGLGTVQRPGFIGTIHALALHILNAHGYILGYKPDVEVLPEEDSRELMKNICEGLKANIHGAWKARGNIMRKTVEQLAAKAHLTHLRIGNKTDFACMLLEATRIMDLREDQDYHIYVDEYQDTTIEEADLLRSLKPRGWIIIGDEDQSIFSWDKSLDNFYAWDSQVMALEENRRSRESVCLASNCLATHFQHYRPGAKPMTWIKEGGVVQHFQYDTDSDSIFAAINMANDDIREGHSVAILCRHNYLANQVKAMAGPEIAGISVDMMDGAKASEIRNAQAFISRIEDYDPPMIAIRLLSSNLSNRERRIVEVAVSKSRGSKGMALAALLDPDERGSNRLHIGTVHSFKGREADHVYLVGGENFRWERKQTNTNDERKIFYVALTRARTSFTSIYAKRIYVEGRGEMEAQPTQFIEEMSIPSID